MNSYKEAIEVLKNRTSKKLENNTYLIKDGENIAIKLHQTNVVTYKPNGDIVLNSGGWKTVTTKDRINKYSNARIFQKNNQWFLGDFIFNDGVIISKGKVKNALKNTPVKEKAFTKEKKVIKDYCKAFVTALFDGKVEKPSSGDCWGCFMKTENGETPLGDNSDHLIQHVKENYFVPSLLVNALTWRGSGFTKGVIGSMWHENRKPSDYEKGIAGDEITKTLYRYIMQKTGHSNSVINFK